MLFRRMHGCQGEKQSPVSFAYFNSFLRSTCTRVLVLINQDVFGQITLKLQDVLITWTSGYSNANLKELPFCYSLASLASHSPVQQTQYYGKLYIGSTTIKLTIFGSQKVIFWLLEHPRNVCSVVLWFSRIFYIFFT